MPVLACFQTSKIGALSNKKTADEPTTPEYSTAPLGCILGPTPLYGLRPSPDTFEAIHCLEIENDTDSPRTELARAGIPLAPGITDVDGLGVVGPGEQQVPAQFKVLARWNGTVDDTSRPIQWLEVGLLATVDAHDKAVYELRRFDNHVYEDPLSARILPTADGYEVHTGVASFELSPAHSSLLVAIHEISSNQEKRPIAHGGTGAGPKLVLEDGTSLSGTNSVRIDADGFQILESGPVRVTVQQKGHFVGPGSTTTCPGSNDQRFGYTVEMSFSRGQRDLDLKFHFRNECGNPTPPWTDEPVRVNEVSWAFPIIFHEGPTAWAGGSGVVAPVPMSTRSRLSLEQQKGRGSQWTRQAVIVADNQRHEEAEFFLNPVLAMSDDRLSASIHMPWMRRREPQGLRITGTTLEFLFVSESLLIGEAKGLWNYGRLNLRPALKNNELEDLRHETQYALERGLLLRLPLAELNATGVLPNLGDTQDTPLKTRYLSILNQLHTDTIREGGQWDRAKTYGSQLWPETVLDQWLIDHDTPYAHPAKMNYWNPSGLELLEFMRSGHPKWAWDLALPSSWLQMYTAYYNNGDYEHGWSNGFAVTSGGSGEGQWHRSSLGSSDYSYNQGMFLAYLLQPSGVFRDRFKSAGLTTLRRYNVPRERESERELFFTQVRPTRQVLQHFEMLMNCAKFVPGETGRRCLERLHQFVTELTEDNLRTGLMCTDDVPSTDHCDGPQQFMINAMHYAFFHRYYRNFGDPNGLLKNALTKMATVYYTYGLQKNSDGRSVDASAPFASRLACDLTDNGTQVANCTRARDGDNRTAMWDHNKPHTLTMLFLSHEITPSLKLCEITKDAYDTPGFLDNWNGSIRDGIGYWKGANQMLQGVIFSVGAYDSCQD